MKIARVTWEDSHGVAQEWGEHDLKPLTCLSIGYIKEHEDYVVIMPHYCERQEVTCGDMCIPRSSISIIDYLGVLDTKYKEGE